MTPDNALERTTEASSSAGRLLAGKCLCGAVQYSVRDEFRYALNCHCSNCRRATGSAFKPFAGIERPKLSVIAGEDALLLFGAEHAHDVRCKYCGSLLYSVVRDGEYVHVTLGTLVDTPTIQPTAHIFVGSKAPWHAITDRLPQHEELQSNTGERTGDLRELPGRRLMVIIRPAVVEEASDLSSLAMRAKAHWGYASEALERWRPELAISPADIREKPTFVAIVGNQVAGFYSLRPSRVTWELDNLWVLPELMHQGIGRGLLSHALETAAQGGASEVTVDADPNAEPFYLECGAVRRGEVPAPIGGQPSRVRPQLVFAQLGNALE